MGLNVYIRQLLKAKENSKYLFSTTQEVLYCSRQFLSRKSLQFYTKEKIRMYF